MTITIRNVPEEVRGVLADRAARAEQSLSTYLRARLIDWATQPPAQEWAERVGGCDSAANRAITPSVSFDARDVDRR